MEQVRAWRKRYVEIKKVLFPNGEEIFLIKIAMAQPMVHGQIIPNQKTETNVATLSTAPAPRAKLARDCPKTCIFETMGERDPRRCA